MHNLDPQARVPASPSPEALRRSGQVTTLSVPTILLHWSVGLAVIGMLAYGFWLQTVPTGSDKTPLVQIHKSFGILVFALALVRLAWRWREGFPPAAGAYPTWERRAARTLQGFMILATILMPVSGILRSLAYGRPVSLFGLPLIPKLFEEKQETYYAAAANLHDGLALVLALAVALHVVAGLSHGGRKGDGTLARMFGRAG